MTNKEVCLRLSSPERKQKMGVQGEWSRTHEDHTSTHLYTTTRTPVERVSNFRHLGLHVASKICWAFHVCTKVQKSARPSCVVSVPSGPVKLSCVCTAEQTHNPSSGIELLCGTGIFRSKPKRDCDVLSAQAPVF